MPFQILLSTSKLPDNLHVAFCNNLLLPLVSGKIPNFLHTEPSQKQVESTLLSIKGTTQSFAANAKISLIIEQMLLYMTSREILESTDALRTAMEVGVHARQSVYGTRKGRKGNAQEEIQAKELLDACSERMLGMLELLEMKEGKPPQPFDLTSRTGRTFSSFASGPSLSDAPGSETDVEQ
jgi:hypothetical protein